ncbi:uncharacterized protein BDZ99DRAFT_478077 [Mytilinidion resinicola]|uniref:Uncharacterized protein n=1 Tax=Mytilinidion resinicola TaxID=574789 RepID=A0A6A6YKV6_9PEZI|nr:uncharacterized protein BDZ99DRAFT_478077 [Mytilinidion resinicola]KAF2808605.1 hypothetical protein BDZ99DRAFT_478077 [Mytilinidion resinicola]
MSGISTSPHAGRCTAALPRGHQEGTAPACDEVGDSLAPQPAAGGGAGVAACSCHELLARRWRGTTLPALPDQPATITDVDERVPAVVLLESSGLPVWASRRGRFRR